MCWWRRGLHELSLTLNEKWTWFHPNPGEVFQRLFHRVQFSLKKPRRRGWNLGTTKKPNERNCSMPLSDKTIMLSSSRLTKRTLNTIYNLTRRLCFALFIFKSLKCAKRITYSKIQQLKTQERFEVRRKEENLIQITNISMLKNNHTNNIGIIGGGHY